MRVNSSLLLQIVDCPKKEEIAKLACAFQDNYILMTKFYTKEVNTELLITMKSQVGFLLCAYEILYLEYFIQ